VENSSDSKKEGRNWGKKKGKKSPKEQWGKKKHESGRNFSKKHVNNGAGGRRRGKNT